jgi:beta-lactamase class A
MVRAFTLLLAAPAFATPMAPLQARLDGLAAAAPGRLEVAVLDLDSGARAAVRGQEPAPMASVFKLPTAVAVLHRAHRESIPLSTLVHVRWEERSPGWSPLGERVPPAGLDVTLDALIESMVGESDNTSADVLLRWMGGPGEVTAVLRQLGVGGLRVDRSERTIAYHAAGLLPPARPESLEALLSRVGSVPEARRLDALRRFSADPRDQASPEALVNLLAALDSGRLLEPAHTARLLEVMRATRTGPRRLRAGLPQDAVLAHKTGTGFSRRGFSVGVNDVGIVTGGGRRLAIAVLLKDADASIERCEDVVAEVARAVWEPGGTAL